MAFADSLKWFFDWLPAILGMDLMTFFKMFFIKKSVKTPSGSVLMTDYEMVTYLNKEGYTEHEKHITETPPPAYVPPSYTESAEMEAARKAEQARLAALSEPEKTAYLEQQTTIEQMHTEQQRQVFRTVDATGTTQTYAVKSTSPAPISSSTIQPIPDSDAPPTIDTAYENYEARRANLE
jgi:hypothetical protein